MNLCLISSKVSVFQPKLRLPLHRERKSLYIEHSFRNPKNNRVFEFPQHLFIHNNLKKSHYIMKWYQNQAHNYFSTFSPTMLLKVAPFQIHRKCLTLNSGKKMINSKSQGILKSFNFLRQKKSCSFFITTFM